MTAEAPLPARIDRARIAVGRNRSGVRRYPNPGTKSRSARNGDGRIGLAKLRLNANAPATMRLSRVGFRFRRTVHPPSSASPQVATGTRTNANGIGSRVNGSVSEYWRVKTLTRSPPDHSWRAYPNS